MPKRPLTLDVLVQPVPQPRPLSDQGLMRDLHLVVIAAEQPCIDKSLHEIVVCRIEHQPLAGDPGPGRLSVLTWHHQAEQQGPQLAALPLIQSRVEMFGGLGDCVANTPGQPVALDGQRRAFPVLPGLAQYVREHRQGPRFAFDLPDQQVDKSRLEPKAGMTGWSFDGRAQIVFAHRSQQVEAAVQKTCERRIAR